MDWARGSPRAEASGQATRDGSSSKGWMVRGGRNNRVWVVWVDERIGWLVRGREAARELIERSAAHRGQLLVGGARLIELLEFKFEYYSDRGWEEMNGT